MPIDSVFDYAGNLSMELEEFEKLIPNEEQTENAVTLTFLCDALLTIMCC